jgi:CPA2 family monovalent cation:H+ antiporter-2
MDSSVHDLSRVLIELGLVVIGLAILARIASRWGFSAIPLYLLAGLAFGKGGLAPLNLSAGFTHIGAEIGVLLLLFMLGLEYTGRELVANLRTAFPAAIVDFALNFTPGVIAGLLLKWKPLPAVLLGGVTYVSSSGVIAKLLAELRQINNPETPAVLSILVLEDLAMAIYLPLVAVLLAGGGPAKMALSVSVALAAVLLVLALAVRYGAPLSRVVAHQSDEIVLLTTFGAVLLVAGAAQRVQVSAAIGAFLVGIAVSGPMAEQTHRLLAPLRDLFAATFFFFFGLQIDPATLPPALIPAGRCAGCGNRRDQNSDRFLERSRSRCRSPRTPARRHGLSGAWRVLHCDCRLGCWPSAATWTNFSRLRAASGGARSHSGTRGSLAKGSALHIP